MVELSRRNLLAVGALSGVAAMSPAHAQISCPNAVPEKWYEACDVVVIGSGFAGLAAAAEAHRGGASAVVLEKMPSLGGNSIINGGIISVSGNFLQKKLGIEDSPELLVQDMLREGLG